MKTPNAQLAIRLSVAVLRLDVVGKGLGLLEGRVVVVVVMVVVVLGANVLHLVDAAALGATLDGAVAGHTQPCDTVGVGGESGAAGKLLVAGRLDHDRVLHRAEAAGVEWAHVENVNTLHLSENLETLKTGSLLEIGGDSAGGSTGTEEVLLALHLIEDLVVANLLLGSTSKSSGLLVGGGRVLGSLAADNGGGEAAGDKTSGDRSAASRDGDSALEEHRGIGFGGSVMW